MDYECPECGSDMEEDPEEPVLVCPECGYEESEDVDDPRAGLTDPVAGRRTQSSVCVRGHALVRDVLDDEEHEEPCPMCGADVITGCQWCGLDFDTEIEFAEARLRCPRCERPFPWNDEAKSARRTALLRILGAIAAGATIIASMLYASTFLG